MVRINTYLEIPDDSLYHFILVSAWPLTAHSSVLPALLVLPRATAVRIDRIYQHVDT